MKIFQRSSRAGASVAAIMIMATLATPFADNVAHPTLASATWPPSGHLNCSTAYALCTDVYNSYQTFGYYVGHDEPSLLFYSNQPGSGNQMAYSLILPKDPPTAPPKGTDTFQLTPAFWFGMAMCATKSYPEQLNTCTPDSDSNIVDPAVSAQHPGAAFMEMQFYPPGWAPFQLPGGISCDPTRWCGALNIDSYAQDPVHNTQLNSTCAARVGVEYVNFAFITRDGRAQAPANPVDATAATYTPDPTRDLFMNPGDKITVIMHDTPEGLQIVINDLTTGQSGSMTASAANGFGQVEYRPDPSHECANLPYDFHPMYSTSSEQTRVPWTAHSYNISFATEIGHWDYCSAVNTTTGTCTGAEGVSGDRESNDVDDTFCLSAAQSLLVPVAGCPGTNGGFDGTTYQPNWPDGNTQMHPTPITVTSPQTGSNYDINYARMAFEGDQPRIEYSDITNSEYPCNALTGANCTLIPLTDENVPATFYPFYTKAQSGHHCAWTIGNDIPGVTTSDFGGVAQYGKILPLTYTNGGGVIRLYEDFRQVLAPNPCVNP